MSSLQACPGKLTTIWEMRKLCEFDYPPNYSLLGRAVTFPQSIRPARVSLSMQGKIILGVSEAHKNLQASLRSVLQTPKLEKMSFGGECGNHQDHKRSSNIRWEESGCFPTLLGEHSVDLRGKSGNLLDNVGPITCETIKQTLCFTEWLSSMEGTINCDMFLKFLKYFQWRC